MKPGGDNEPWGLLGHVLVPGANENAARRTPRILARYESDRSTGLHVVEKTNSLPDETPVARSEAIAAVAFAAVEEAFPTADEYRARTRDIVAAICETAEQVDASATAYRFRGGERIIPVLGRGRPLELVTRAGRPVIALPGRGSTG